MTGCDFMDLGKAQITLEPEVEAALIYGNRLREKELITNRAGRLRPDRHERGFQQIGTGMGQLQLL